MTDNNKKPSAKLTIFSDRLSNKEKSRTIFWLVYFLVVFLAQVWPGYLIGNRIHPRILGIPFSMFWVVIWILIAFIGLTIRFRQEYGGEK